MSGRLRRADPGTGATPRGQTIPDFVLAIGVFVVAVALVFGFLPTMLDPFTGDRAEGAVADRVADAVVDDLTDDARAPAVLNATKTTAYFAGEVDLPDKVGVTATADVNVTIGHPVQGSSSLQVLCGQDGTLTTCPADGDALQAGPPVPSSSTTEATARRAVVVDDRIAIVEVRVWS